MTRGVHAVRRRSDAARASGEDGVAMLVALMMIMLLSALSVVVLAVVVGQMGPTHFAEKNTRTVYAAEAGVEATLGAIRTAAGSPDFRGKVFGNPKNLPCSLTGAVNDDNDDGAYTVLVQYFSEDPVPHDDAWRAGHAMACVEGNGTGTTMPQYAYITAHGQAGSSALVASDQGDRTMSMSYQFETTTTNILGGRIFSWANSADATWCLRAEGTTAGSAVTYRTAASCGGAGSENTELWVYDRDYTIALASSVDATRLCLTQTGSGNDVKLETCTGDSTQQWAWHPDGNASWVAQDPGSVDTNPKLCLGTNLGSGASPSDGGRLKLMTCANQEPRGSFNPDAAVGPGAASVYTHQIVNYLEFGRCFDVTDTQVTSTFMISYPCKQDPPAGAALAWNHKWFYDEPEAGVVGAPQLIYVLQNNSTKYCLKTPAAETNPNLQGVHAGWYPILTSSCNLADQTQQWIRSKATGDKTTSWTFRDYTGRCISASGEKYKAKWTSLVVAACDGSTAQKWNAPAIQVEAEVGDYTEAAGG